MVRVLPNWVIMIQLKKIINMDKETLSKYINAGAQPTDTAAALIKKFKAQVQ